MQPAWGAQHGVWAQIRDLECSGCPTQSLQTLAGKGRAREASDDSSEASSKEFGEEDDDEEGNYEVEEDEEELEEASESEGEWGILTALGTRGFFCPVRRGFTHPGVGTWQLWEQRAKGSGVPRPSEPPAPFSSSQTPPARGTQTLLGTLQVTLPGFHLSPPWGDPFLAAPALHSLGFLQWELCAQTLLEPLPVPCPQFPFVSSLRGGTLCPPSVPSPAGLTSTN